VDLPDVTLHTTGAVSVRQVDGRYVCERCGAILCEPHVEDAVATIVGEGGKANVQVLTIGRREIHRCEIGDRRS